LVRLAVRNALRHRTRSLVAISAIAFGVIAILSAGGFVEWIFWAIREAAIQAGLGHVHVVERGYRQSGLADPFSYLLPQQSPELTLLERAPEVKAVAPRLNFGGLVSHGDATLSFIGEGVDVDKEALISRVLYLPVGVGLSDSDLHGVIVGVGLAANLGVKPGDPIVLLTTSASGSINAVDAHVRGLFRSELKAYDDSAIRVPIGLARQLLKVRGSHVWIVGLDDTDHTRQWIDETRARLKGTKLELIPWFDLADFYNKSVTLLSRQLSVVRIIIGLIIVLGISNLLIMSVLERTGEIGTAMALGTSRSRIRLQFLLEGSFLGVAGAVAGVLIGIMLALLVSRIGIPMPPPPGRQVGYSAGIMLTWRLVLGTLALAILTTMLASLYPAWKASRLAIVDALRHNR
jgi:putative ABC transport system permease protein